MATTTLALSRGDLSEVTSCLFLARERSRWSAVLVEARPGSLGLGLSAPGSGQSRAVEKQPDTPARPEVPSPLRVLRGVSGKAGDALWLLSLGIRPWAPDESREVNPVRERPTAPRVTTISLPNQHWEGGVLPPL